MIRPAPEGAIRITLSPLAAQGAVGFHRRRSMEAIKRRRYEEAAMLRHKKTLARAAARTGVEGWTVTAASALLAGTALTLASLLH